VLTWVVRLRRDIVVKAMFLDPICFLLAQPDVAVNFLYSAPDGFIKKAAAHLVRWELFAANVLRRHFYWYHNNCWLDELPDDCVVLLSGKDHIIDPPLIRRYLETHKARTSSEFELLWVEEFTHGGFLNDKPFQMQLLEILGCAGNSPDREEDEDEDGDTESGKDEGDEVPEEEAVRTPSGTMRLIKRLQGFMQGG